MMTRLAAYRKTLLICLMMHGQILREDVGNGDLLLAAER